MLALVYRSHFLYLAAGIPVLCALALLPAPNWLNRGTVIFALVGTIHGTAVVFSLNRKGAWPSRVLFVALAAAMSSIAPWAGLLIVSLLALPDSIALIAAYALASAVGAAAYWFAIRRMWIPILTLASAGWVIGLCAGASAASGVISAALTGFGAGSSLGADILPSVVWWFTFSSSIYISETSWYDR